MIEAYPLTWPVNKDRTPLQARKRATFGTQRAGSTSRQRLTVAEGLARVMTELGRFTPIGRNYRIPKDSIVISTNIPTGRHGLPYSDGRKEPSDVGVAVYFTLDGRAYCTPCDAWDRVADNMAAIAAHLECLRGIERYKVGESHDVFTGHKTLPWSSDTPKPRPWWQVLCVKEDAGWNEVEANYRALAKATHPDSSGGSNEAFIELEKAYALAEKHLKPTT